MAGLKEFYCGSNKPSHASQFKWLEYTFKGTFQQELTEVKIRLKHRKSLTVCQVLYFILHAISRAAQNRLLNNN